MLKETKNNFLLSIIVPTRNRQEYAAFTARQILSLNSTDVQLVIQDNSDTNSLELILKEFSGDLRLKYNYSPGTISFVKNFSIAVSLAEGEYLCIIGDDDGVNPEILKIAKWAKENNIDAIKPGLNAVFFWPDTGIDSKKIDEKGQVVFNKISGKCETYNTEEQLVNLLRNGCQKYLKSELVKIYHGIVHRKHMDKIKSITGEFFNGLSPDIFAAVSLSIIVPEIISLDYPLTISGICRNSGSADSATGKHTGQLKDAPHFKGHLNYKWSEEVPEFYSVETIWADSALSAVKNMHADHLLKEFRLEFLTAYSLKARQFRKIVLTHYFNRKEKTGTIKSLSVFLLFKSIISGPCFDFLIRVLKRLTRKKSSIFKKSGIKDICQAEKELSAYLTDNGIKTDLILENLNKLTSLGRN